MRGIHSSHAEQLGFDLRGEDRIVRSFHGSNLIGRRHGAHKSLRVLNKMGATPLDLARVFGPFPAVETKLGSAMLNHDFDTQFAIRHGSLLRRRAGGSVVEPEPDNDAPTTPLQSDARPAEPTRTEITVQDNEPGTGGDSAPAVDTAGTHAVPTTAVGGTG